MDQVGLSSRDCVLCVLHRRTQSLFVSLGLVRSRQYSYFSSRQLSVIEIWQMLRSSPPWSSKVTEVNLVLDVRSHFEAVKLREH